MDFLEHPLLHMADLMQTLLRVASEEEGATLADCLDELKATLERAGEKPPVTDREIVEHLQEARRHLVKAKLLELVGNGRFRITERGRRVLAEHPLGVDDSVLVQFPEFRRYIRKPRAPKDVEVPRAREYTLGYEAYRAGRGLDDNPYRFDNADHLAWENGWFEARDDDAKSGRS
ncbi:MAG TPA: winged helix-turn-helix domain-containing protein [Alphaproteobacteria bacterium]